MNYKVFFLTFFIIVILLLLVLAGSSNVKNLPFFDVVSIKYEVDGLWERDQSDYLTADDLERFRVDDIAVQVSVSSDDLSVFLYSDKPGATVTLQSIYMADNDGSVVTNKKQMNLPLSVGETLDDGLYQGWSVIDFIPENTISQADSAVVTIRVQGSSETKDITYHVKVKRYYGIPFFFKYT